MSERLYLLDQYSQALAIYDRAKAHLEAIKVELKALGTFREGDWSVDLSVISKRSIALSAIQKARPDLLKALEEAGLITTSESERLTVKLKQGGSESE